MVLEALGFRDPLLALVWLIVAGAAGLVIGVLVRRPKPSGCKNATTERPSQAGEPRLVDLTHKPQTQGDPVLGALAARTEKLLREAMERGLVEPRLYSPRCPEARVVIDPVSMEVLCIDAEGERGRPLEATGATGEEVVIEEVEEPEPEEAEREARERRPRRRGREA